MLVSGEEKDPVNALERAYLQEHHNEAERGDTRQIGAQIAGEGEQGIGSRPQESPIGGSENWAGFSESSKEPTDIGAEGKPQLVIDSGAEKIGQGELAQRAANAPLKPTVAQKPADEGLFGDTHKQKDLFGEGTPSPSTMKELGPFEHDKSSPLGGQAQKYTLDRGKATGLEHLVAFDANGNVVAHGSGTANNTGMTPRHSKLH